MITDKEILDKYSLIRPIMNGKVWSYIGYSMLVNEYKRTVLGPIWILLQLIIFLLAVGSIYSGILNEGFFDYLSYMSSGMIGWVWAGAMLNSSGMVYINNESLIKSVRINKSYLLWSHVFYNLLVLLHQIPIMILFYFSNSIEFNFSIFYLLPTLTLIFLLNIGVSAAMSIIVNRYRDIHKILISLTIVIMISTPIFWKPEMVSGLREYIYLLNPFYYIIQSIRNPLLGVFDYNIFKILILMTILTFFLGTYMHNKYSKNIVFRL